MEVVDVVVVWLVSSGQWYLPALRCCVASNTLLFVSAMNDTETATTALFEHSNHKAPKLFQRAAGSGGNGAMSRSGRRIGKELVVEGIGAYTQVGNIVGGVGVDGVGVDGVGGVGVGVGVCIGGNGARSRCRWPGCPTE